MSSLNTMLLVDYRYRKLKCALCIIRTVHVYRSATGQQDATLLSVGISDSCHKALVDCSLSASLAQ
jgi:hypothetical protein